jgi:hypothetical protein
VGWIYRSPSSLKDNNQKLNDLISKARDLKYSYYLIMGDFNYPEIDWLKNEVMDNRQSDALKKKFTVSWRTFYSNIYAHLLESVRVKLLIF